MNLSIMKCLINWDRGGATTVVVYDDWMAPLHDLHNARWITLLGSKQLSDDGIRVVYAITELGHIMFKMHS
jgi:hypothetical protein